MNQDRCEGALLGLALGDAHGAPYEGGPIERLLWRAIGNTANGRRRWTDDTQMSLDLLHSLIEFGRIEQQDIARRFAASYRWSRGYGPGAAKILKRIHKGMAWEQANRSVYPDGSFGNGGAMRAPVVGVFCANREESLAQACHDTAVITHAHPQAISGAHLIGFVTLRALHDDSAMQIMQRLPTLGLDAAYRAPIAQASQWLAADYAATPREVARTLGNAISAVGSTPAACYLALRFFDQDFDALLRFVCTGGGDTDTIAAMAGAIWGARNGHSALPRSLLERTEQADEIRALAATLYASLPGD